MVLDSFYGHGLGIEVFWPFSTGRLNFPIPWFRTVDKSHHLLAQRNLTVYAIELVSYAPILTAAIVARILVRRHARANTASPVPDS